MDALLCKWKRRVRGEHARRQAEDDVRDLSFMAAGNHVIVHIHVVLEESKVVGHIRLDESMRES